MVRDLWVEKIINSKVRKVRTGIATNCIGFVLRVFSCSKNSLSLLKIRF